MFDAENQSQLFRTNLNYKKMILPRLLLGAEGYKCMKKVDPNPKKP